MNTRVLYKRQFLGTWGLLSHVAEMLNEHEIPKGNILLALKDGALIAEGIVETSKRSLEEINVQNKTINWQSDENIIRNELGKDIWNNIDRILTGELYFASNYISSISGFTLFYPKFIIAQNVMYRDICHFYIFSIRVRLDDVEKIWPLILEDQNMPTISKPGRPPGADWEALGMAIAAECEKQGTIPPDTEGVKGWRTRADVVRWAIEFLSDREESSGESTIKGHVKQILDNLRALPKASKSIFHI